MSSENTVRTFEFSAAGPGPWVPASNSLLVQTDVSVTVEAVTLIGQAPEVLGVVTANSFARYDTAHAFVRLVAAGAGSAAVSASIPAAADASGGGGTSDTTEATQLLVKAAVQGIDTDLGAPADAAATSDAGTFSLIALVKRGLGNWSTLLDRIPSLAGGRIPVDTSGTIQLGAGVVSASTQRVTLASDGLEVTNSTGILARLVSLDDKTPPLVQKQVIDEAGSSVTYIGEAPLGTALSAAAWRVKRITTAGTLTTIEFSPANSIFNNRASLGYT